MPIERLPELRYEAGPVDRPLGRRQRWLETNQTFHDSILDQLRDRGPLQSRDIDDSTLVKGWQSTGWTHGKNTTRMLEFMGKGAGGRRCRREWPGALWDLPERVIPTDAPTRDADDDEYAERKIETAMAALRRCRSRDIKQRTYWVTETSAAEAPSTDCRGEGRLVPVSLPRIRLKRPAWATPDALDAGRDGAGVARRPCCRPSTDSSMTASERCELFDFDYKLEMYVPKEERKFGHFTLPVLHDNELVGRLDSQVDRKSNVLVVNKLHWEDGQPKAATRRAVDAAIAELAAFVGASEVSGL